MHSNVQQLEELMEMATKTVRAPFRGDHVGSFLRPERLKQARIQFVAGEITSEQLRDIENERSFN
jgi:5-methyltetrahydropteroyltriglutamate--homocysteine methyltransferase